MPTYVYKNMVTGETFEIQQRITEDALTVHPETGDPVKRLIQPVGIAFKGSGFYVNDSRSTSKARKSGSAGGADGAGEASKTSTESGTTSGAVATASGSSGSTPSGTP